MDRGAPDSAGYAGNPAATGTGGMVLLGFFLAFGSSAPARTNCGGGVVAWIVGTVTTPGAQGSWWPRRRRSGTVRSFLVSDAGIPGWSLGPSLLISASGAQTAPPGLNFFSIV